MIDLLPAYYRKSKVVIDLYNVIQKAIVKTQTDISNMDIQLFITTATEFEKHEKDVGLSAISADIETKRSRVISRIQGNSLLTIAELEKLVNIYDKTGCTVTEDYKNYTVHIVFSGRTGKPYNLEEIQKAIDEVKPAHIKIEYDFIVNTWNDIKNKLGTWGNASAFTWDGLREYDGRTWLYVDGDTVYLRENGANAYVILKNNEPYARLL